MKKIIDGVTYNTETSTAIGRAEREAEHNDPKSYEWTLYQTRGGAFFVHTHATWGVKKDDEWVDRESHEFKSLTRDEAQKWMLEGEVEVLNNVFEDPPEAAAETTASTTIYLRVPETLKRAIEKKAKAENESVNVWAMRCLEECARAGERPLFVDSHPKQSG